MAEGGKGSCKEAVEAMVESMLYCSKCDKYSLETFAYIACDHVICDECVHPDQPSTTCPLCGKDSTQMNFATDAKFMRLRGLTSQLADLMQIKCEQKRVTTKVTNAMESSKRGKPNVENDLKVAVQEPNGKDVSAADGVKKKTRARCNKKKTPNEMAVSASDLDKLIVTKNLRNKCTVETKGANLADGDSNNLDEINTAKTSGVIQPKKSSKKVTKNPTASETIVIPDEKDDLPSAGLTSPKAKSDGTGSGTSKVIRLNRSKFQAHLGSETPANKTAAENHQTPRRVQGQTSKATLKKTANQDAERTDRLKDVVAFSMKSVKNVKKMTTPRTDKRNTRGETPLHVACIHGDLQKVQSLIAEGADVNSIDNAHWSPLHEAAQRGFVEVARSLIVAGALTNVPGVDNTTPLHDAVAYNNLEMVELLVQLGADTNSRNSNGKKPIDLATSEVMRAAFAVKSVAPLPIKPKPAPVVNRQMVVFADKPTWSTYQAQLNVVAKLLGRKIVNKLAKEVTHVISETSLDGMCKPSASILHGMLLGAAIINDSWISMCAENDCIIDPLLFEFGGTYNFPTSNAPRRAYRNARNQLPGLFDNCNFFLRHITEDYVSGDLRLTKLELINLIKVGGGTVLSREPNPENISKKEVLCPYHAHAGGLLEHCTHYIIYQTGDDKIKYNMQHIKALPTEWLVDCMESFALLDHVPYLQVTMD